mgnify:CR=1 FL=1
MKLVGEVPSENSKDDVLKVVGTEKYVWLDSRAMSVKVITTRRTCEKCLLEN